MRHGLLTSIALTCAFCLARPAPGVVEYRDVGELTRQARQIVIGDVVDVESHWNTDHSLIRSRVIVQVTDYLLGQGSGREVLELAGGTVDDLTLRVSVLPTFEAGDHVFLFLGDSEIRLVESFQGAYLTDGKQIARMAPGCHRVIAESVQSLASFVDTIERALPEGLSLRELSPYEGDFELPLGNGRYGLCGYDWTYMGNPMGEDYRINPNCVDNSAGDQASQIQQMQNGMAGWNNSGADFAFTYGGTSSQTDVTYNGTNLMYFDLTPPEGGDYIAANFHWVQGANMIESDIVFNDANYTWWNGSGYCNWMMDIWNIATHELGHTLCLVDLYGGGDAQKTMYGYADHCETKKRTLHQDDINGIIAIYGVVMPENDDCNAGLLVYEGAYPFTNINATTDGPDEPDLCTFNGYSQIDSDVWFRYWPGCTGQATVDLCESDYDTKVAVYEAACPTGPNQAIACDDDSCDPQSIVTFPVEQGTFYYIRVGGYYGAEGTGTMIITCEPGDECPADFDGDGDVDTADLLYLLGAWGTPDGDVDGDGDTDTADLLDLLAAWGDCP
jgi:hypothetical protein